MYRITAVLILLLASPVGATAQEAAAAQEPAAAQAAGLTLAEAWALAAQHNPMMRAALARVDASVAAAPSAGLPPDPSVQLGVMNLSLPRLGAEMPGAMLPSIQLMQMIPVGGKLRLTGELARQQTAIHAAEASEVYWELRAGVAAAWHQVRSADRQLDVMQETLEWLRQFEQVATTMYSVGNGRQSDVLRAGVEVARMKAEITHMRAMRTAAAARLNALLGRDAGTDVVVAGEPAAAAPLPSAEALLGWADQTRPLLERARLGVARAATAETLSRRELWPDLSVGVQYGQRPADMGTERMGSLMVGFTVPVFASRRQFRMRDEAAAMRSMAAAELDDARAGVDAAIRELLADLQRASSLMELYRTEVLPQAEANVTSAFAAYRVGRVDFMTLLDAQMSVNRYAQELHELEAEYGSALAELEMTTGRALRESALAEEEAA